MATTIEQVIDNAQELAERFHRAEGEAAKLRQEIGSWTIGQGLYITSYRENGNRVASFANSDIYHQAVLDLAGPQETLVRQIEELKSMKDFNSREQSARWAYTSNDGREMALDLNLYHLGINQVPIASWWVEERSANG